MQLISLAEVLHALDTTADPCTIVFATADRQRGTGGELVTLAGCVQTGVPERLKAAAQPASTPTTPAAAAPGAGVLRRKPAHRANQTINLTILSSGKTRKVHVRLLVEYNGQAVRW